MGNQARVLANSTVISTSTRNFPNRLGDGANVFLASAELSAISAVLGKLPTVEEYHQYMSDINPLSDQIYRYLNFNEIENFETNENSNVEPSEGVENNEVEEGTVGNVAKAVGKSIAKGGKIAGKKFSS